MLSDDQYLERTADLVAKVRAMREAAEKEMNRFTRVTDYDVRRVVGHGPKPAQAPSETVAPATACEHPEKPAANSVPAPADRRDEGENA